MKPLRRPAADSPQACGRVLALALLADGELHAAESRMQQAQAAAQALGLDAAAWREVMLGFAEDQRAHRAPWFASACQVDPLLLSAVLGDITRPELRRLLLVQCARLVDANEQFESGEYLVLTAAVEHWGMQCQFIQPEQA